MTHDRGWRIRVLLLAVTCIVAARPAMYANAGCRGDCDGSGTVTIDDLVTMVNVALGLATLSACPAGDADGSGTITVDEIIVAVNSALAGCAAPTATPTALPEEPCPQRNPLRN